MHISRPVKTQPFHIFFDRIYEFGIFLHRIGVIKPQIAAAVVPFCQTEVETNGFCMTYMQITIWFYDGVRLGVIYEPNLSFDSETGKIEQLYLGGRNGFTGMWSEKTYMQITIWFRRKTSIYILRAIGYVFINDCLNKIRCTCYCHSGSSY